MTGLSNLRRPFFRSDYGAVFCLLVFMAYSMFVLVPGFREGWSDDFWAAHATQTLVGTGLLMWAIAALLIHLYRTPENGQPGWPPFRWGGLMAGILGTLLLAGPVFFVERTVANFEPIRITAPPSTR